jgi:hypothetical protein
MKSRMFVYMICVQGLSYVKVYRLFKIVPMGVGTGILMHQQIDPSAKNSLGCTWNHCTAMDWLSKEMGLT